MPTKFLVLGKGGGWVFFGGGRGWRYQFCLYGRGDFLINGSLQVLDRAPSQRATMCPIFCNDFAVTGRDETDISEEKRIFTEVRRGSEASYLKSKTYNLFSLFVLHLLPVENFFCPMQRPDAALWLAGPLQPKGGFTSLTSKGAAGASPPTGIAKGAAGTVVS